MKLLEQETQHKLDVYKLEMDQIVEKEKKVESRRSKMIWYEEEEIRTARKSWLPNIMSNETNS